MKGIFWTMEFQPSSSLKELQRVDIEMLKMLVDIFDKNNIDYFLIAGSLLGAVRHKGFIPWDDDLDIGLPRSDYEKFLEHKDEWLGNQYMAQNFQSNSNYKYYITRVYNKSVKVKELRGTGSETTYASLDLFPIDGTPNNKILREFFINKILFYRMLASLANYNNIDQYRNRGKMEKFFIFIMGFFRTDTWLNQYLIYKHIDQLLKKQSYEKSDYVGSLMGAYRKKEIFKKKYIGNLRSYVFYNFNVSGPENADEYLKHMYGNYMKIPTSNEIKEKKHFEIITHKSI